MQDLSDTGVQTHARNGNGSEERSFSEVVRDLTQHTQQLVKGEIELVKAEMTDNLSHFAKYAAMGAAAAVFAVSGLIFLGHFIAQSLDEAWPEWASFLAVTVLFLAIAAGLAIATKSGFAKKPIAPTKSVEGAKEDIQWVKTHS